ncbi:T9SS type A sorting domain-containing protein, partial [candidate division KSB1 bacterium]|nr:T9SS type A sorting domain-containing protein [candidate division KSB1 bacterium]
IDTCTSVEAHGYIIIPKRGDRFGSHSDEAVDFPRPPHNVTAAVSNTSPFQVALTWEPPAEAMSVSYRIYRSLAPGVIMSQENLLGATQNTYFIDSLVTEGTTGFYRIVAVNRIGIPSQPSQEVSVLVQKPLNELPDLDVLFISRSPKYPRFAILYDPPGYNPKPDPLTENTRHVPLPGELMCYSATVGNSGGATMGNFNLKWYVDSALVQQESCGMLFPKQRLTSVLRLPWETEPSIIRCEVQPADGASEATKNNNSLKIRTNALSFHFYVEQNIIELFGSHKNPMNSYGFEDWAQVHINQMNRFFADARYPGVTPDGVPEAVFLDTVSYFGNGLLPPGGTHAPEAVVWDGQWGFTGDPNAINYFENIVLGRDNGMDWALLHELGHQIGLIDLYQMDVSQPQMRVIEPRTGQKPPLRPIAWDVLHYCSRSQYIMHSNFQNGFSDHSAGALRRNTGKRRGYFGEYLADIPKRNSLLVQRKDGTPVQFAEIRVYQKQDGQIPDLAKFTGLTDSTGRFEFPRNADSAYYGGLRVKNPFSTIHSSDPHVVATNATLFIRVAKGDSVGYAFMDICGFNVAFWSGDSISATYPLTISQWHIMPISGLRSDIRIQTATYKLFQNYPNPFNATTEIRYQLPISTSVRIDILNILGQRIRTLVNGKQHKGNHSVAWDGNDDSGRHLSSGIYYYIFKADEYEQTAKMLLLN